MSPEELARALVADGDRRGAVWCAALCALTLQHLAPIQDNRPMRAIRLAMKWAQGADVPREVLMRAASVPNVSYTAILAASAAAKAAVYATAAHVANAVAYAADAQAFTYAADAELSELLRLQMEPVEYFDSESPLGDWLLEHSSPRRIGTLGDALARARKRRLRWCVLEQRAFAERFDKLPSGWLPRPSA